MALSSRAHGRALELTPDVRPLWDADSIEGRLWTLQALERPGVVSRQPSRAAVLADMHMRVSWRMSEAPWRPLRFLLITGLLLVAIAVVVLAAGNYVPGWWLLGAALVLNRVVFDRAGRAGAARSNVDVAIADESVAAVATVARIHRQLAPVRLDRVRSLRRGVVALSLLYLLVAGAALAQSQRDEIGPLGFSCVSPSAAVLSRVLPVETVAPEHIADPARTSDHVNVLAVSGPSALGIRCQSALRGELAAWEDRFAAAESQVDDRAGVAVPSDVAALLETEELDGTIWKLSFRYNDALVLMTTRYELSVDEAADLVNSFVKRAAPRF